MFTLTHDLRLPFAYPPRPEPFMKRLLKLALCLLSAFLTVLLAPAENAAGGDIDLPKKIVVALKPDKNPDHMLEEKAALETFLSAQLNVPVEVIIPLSSAVIIEGFANGTIDLGYLSSTDTVRARRANAADVLLAGLIDGKPYYQSYWLALKDKPYNSVKDLGGKPVAFASKTSTSGCIIPLWDLRSQGLISAEGSPADFFGEGNTWYGSGYVSAVERVLNGEAEAAAVSYYVLDKNRHLSEQQRARLKKVDQQGPVPTHVIAVRETLTGGQREVLRNALAQLNQPANQELRDKVFTSELVVVDADAHLGSLESALRFAEEVASR